MRNKIKIYAPFAFNRIKTEMAYQGAFYLFMIISLFQPFIMYFLWMAIYGSSPDGVLGGMNQDQMVVYIFMVHITASMVNISISDQVSEDVVKGTVAMNLIKPIDYRTSLLAMATGNMVYRFLAPSVFVWIGLEIYKVNVLHMAAVTPVQLLTYLCSTVMSFLIYVLFDFCFGMIAFFTTYIFGMQLAKEALLRFLTGQLIPLSFFPEAVQKVFEFLPFSSMIYTPVMIYLGMYEGTTLAFMLIRQAIWVVLLYVLGSVVWNRVTKRLVVLGG